MPYRVPVIRIADYLSRKKPPTVLSGAGALCESNAGESLSPGRCSDCRDRLEMDNPVGVLPYRVRLSSVEAMPFDIGRLITVCRHC